MTFPLNGTGNIAPTLNIQGSNTQLTGPLGDDASFTYAADQDTDGTIYALDYWAISTGSGTQYAIVAFVSGLNGNVAPTRRIVIDNSFIVSQSTEAQFGGLCVDGHGKVYAALGHWILRFSTAASGSAVGDVFVNANPIWTDFTTGITSLYFDVVRQVIWATYAEDQTDTLGPVVVGYNLDGTTYATIQGAPLSLPTQVAIDINQNVWVADQLGSPTSRGAVFKFAAVGFALLNTMHADSSHDWQSTNIGVGLEQSGLIHVSAGNTGSPSGIGNLYTYPADATGDVSGTQLYTVAGAATYLSNMISGAVTFPAQIRLIS